MIKASALMKAYNQIADKLDLDSRDPALIVDKADLMIVRVLFGKDTVAGQGHEKVESMEQVAALAFKSLADKFPDDLALVKNPWEEFLPGGDHQSNTQVQSSIVGSGLIEYGPDGEAANAYRLTCAKMGFQIGLSVFVKKEPGKLFKIVDLANDVVRLRELDTTTGAFKEKKIVVVEYHIF